MKQIHWAPNCYLDFHQHEGDCFFKIFEFAEEFVVFGVGDFGSSFLVIKPVVTTDFPTEFLDTIVKKHARFLEPPWDSGKDCRISDPEAVYKRAWVFSSLVWRG